MSKAKNQLDLLVSFEQATRISLSLVITPVILLVLGVYIDKKLDSTPLFIFLGIILGVGVGIMHAIRLSKNIKLEGKHE